MTTVPPAPSTFRFSRFSVAVVLWLVVLTVGWMQVSHWTSRPAAWLAQVALEQGAPYWVRAARVVGRMMEVDTRIQAEVPQPGGGVRRGEVVVDAKLGHYGYGLPVLLALLLTARRPSLVRKAVLGYVLLLPFQAFSLVFDLLKQMSMVAIGGAGGLGIDHWQLEGIAFGYQAGALVLPTLVPVVLWLWLDRAYIREVIAPHWRAPRATGPR